MRGLYADIAGFALLRYQFIPSPGHAVQAQCFEFGADITTHD
jgi:hypothetical protein